MASSTSTTTPTVDRPTTAPELSFVPRPPVPMPTRGVDYRSKIVLAPMVRSGELPSRLLALHYGADLVWGPETVDKALIGCTVKTNPRTRTLDFSRVSSNGGRTEDQAKKESVIYRLHPEEEGSRLIFQLGTADPELAVQAASMVAEHCAGIDVNAGCPKPFSTSGGMGAALLTHENGERLCSILRALVAEVGNKHEIGISVKIRLLKTEEDTRTLVTKLCQTGITGLTIHCRTREMRKTEKAIREQLKMVGQVCKEHGVACLMNGDVESRQQAVQLVKDFEVDGAMIATAAEKSPSVFSLEGKADWKDVVTLYIQRAIEVENRWGNTKFLLAQMVPGREVQNCGLSQAKNYSDVVARLAGIGCSPQSEDEKQQLTTRARDLDERLGLTERLTKAERKTQKLAANQAHNAVQAAQKSKRQKKRKLEAAAESRSRSRSPPRKQHISDQSDYMTDLHADIVGPSQSQAQANSVTA